jgi:uncharacterized protein
MKFEILAERNANDKKIFFYDNVTNTLTREDDQHIFEYQKIEPHNFKVATVFDKNNPLKKSKKVTLLKIQLGLSCNYTCDYCSQKFVERPTETSKKDIDALIEMLEKLEFDEERGLKIEFWGGEPLVYWKTLKPLAEEIKEKFSHWRDGPALSIITNGSILTKEMSMWLYYMGFSVAISHDGPGQSVRGPDPFDDPKQKKIILDFYKIMKRSGRISFNTMMNSKNTSRKAVRDWFVEITGDPDVALGEGGIVDAYDEDGITNSLQTLKEHFDYRRQSFNDIFSTNGEINNYMVLEKIDSFSRSVLSHTNSMYLPQKCGMDMEDTIAIDMRGNIITCQNVSAVETAMNGESHLVGHISDIESAEVKSATHWSNRKECSSCPVLHLCKGACMFLDKKFWDISCANAYSDNVALFALSFERITDGYIPVTIKGDGLPLERQDIWGTVYQHKEPERRKIIPIKVVAEKVALIDEVEVYGKSRVERVE